MTTPAEKPTKRISKKATAIRKKTAAQIQAEEDLRWERWQKRVVSLVLSLVCLFVMFNELILADEPSETKIVVAATVLGVPIILSGTNRGKS